MAFVLLALALTCALLLAATKSAHAQPDPDRDNTALPVVTIGVIADNEPYSAVEAGRVSGFSIDVLEEIAQRAGIRFEYRAGSWPEIYPAFLRGEIDAIDEISYREDRAALMRFTEPYHFRRTVIMHDSTRPVPAVDSLDALAPHRIGIVRDIYYKNAFTERGLEVTEYDGLPNLVRALAFGWVDAIAGPELTLLYLAHKAGFNHLAIAARPEMDGFELEDFRIAVRAADQALHTRLATALAQVPRERLAALVRTWQEFGGQAVGKTTRFRLSEGQTNYIGRLGPLRVGIMRDYAPFSFVGGGKLQGLAVDVLARVQDITGLQVIPVADRWTVLLDMFQRGEIDVIANISDNPQRREYTRFTKPYHVIPNVVFTRNADLVHTGLESLRGYRIAVTADIFYEQPLRERFGDAVVSFSSQEAMFRALGEGSVDVVLSALPNGQHWVRALGLANVRIGGELQLAGMSGEDLRFGVRPALEPLARIMDIALEAISPTERRTIENRWLGASGPHLQPDAPVEPLALGSADLRWLDARSHHLRVCIDPNRMPLEGFDANGRHTGLSADLLDLFTARAGIRFELIHTDSWTDSIAALRARQCDLVPLAMQTPERRTFLNFTTAYYHIRNILLARIETPFSDSLDELAGHRIGITRGHAFAELLRMRHPRLQLVEVDNEIDALRRLQRGELYAHISTLMSASYHLNELGLADIKVIGRIPGDLALSIATRNDAPQLLTIAQKLVDSLSDADRAQLEQRWRTLQLEPRVDYTRIWLTAAAALVALALLVAWNRKLGALNRELSAANSALALLNVTDSLTGVGNRKFFDQEFEQRFRWCRRHQIGFAVAMIDIDHFKRVNDTYGHQTGDACLRALADCLKAHARRETDRVARLGGEEFAVFSSYDEELEEVARLDALRVAAGEMRINSAHGTLALTISVGVATGIPAPSEHAADFLARADQALYAAKRAGRNMTVHAGAQQDPC